MNKKHCSCGNIIKNLKARRCRNCYLKSPDKNFTHNFSKQELKRRAKLLSRNRKSGKVKTWNKNMNMRLERPDLVQQMIKSLKGKRCNPKGEFKKGHTNSLKERKNLINRHHLDLNKSNNYEDNLLYLTNSDHNSLHKRAYDYLVKTNKITLYLKWFFATFNPQTFSAQEYKLINAKIVKKLRKQNEKI